MTTSKLLSVEELKEMKEMIITNNMNGFLQDNDAWDRIKFLLDDSIKALEQEKEKNRQLVEATQSELEDEAIHLIRAFGSYINNPKEINQLEGIEMLRSRIFDYFEGKKPQAQQNVDTGKNCHSHDKPQAPNGKEETTA